MGSGHWDADAVRAVHTTRSTQSRAQVFTTHAATQLDPTLLLSNKPMRECRDSADHPCSTPIIVAFDVTGSMGDIPHFFATEGIGTVMRELLAKLPVPDPSVCVTAVGDGFTDEAPLQVAEFEADIRVDTWLTKLYLEGNGGGQFHESYPLVWVFGGRHTVSDSMEKRHRKGFLFTIGDELPHTTCTRAQLQSYLGEATAEADISAADALALAQTQYEVFHILVDSRTYQAARSLPEWRKLLGERAVYLADVKALPELITTLVGTTAGLSYGQATAGMDDTKLAVIGKAVSALVPNTGGPPAVPGVVTF